MPAYPFHSEVHMDCPHDHFVGKVICGRGEPKFIVAIFSGTRIFPNLRSREHQTATTLESTQRQMHQARYDGRVGKNLTELSETGPKSAQLLTTQVAMTRWIRVSGYVRPIIPH